MALNQMIIKWSDSVGRGTSSVHDLIAAVDDKLGEMNEVNLSTAFHRIAKLIRNDPKTVEAVKANSKFANLNMSVKISLMQALGWLGHGPAGNHVPMGVSCVCWAYAALRVRDAELFDEVAYRCSPHMGLFKNLEIANLIWAFAKLAHDGRHESDFFNASGKEVRARPDEFSVVNLSTLVWGFATARIKNAKLFRHVAHRMVLLSNEAESQEMANTLWAFATAAQADRALFRIVGNTAANKLELFKPQEVANTAWSFGRIRIRHLYFFDALDRLLGRQASKYQGLQPYQPQHLAQMIGAVATLYPTSEDAVEQPHDEEVVDPEGSDDEGNKKLEAQVRDKVGGHIEDESVTNRSQELALSITSKLLPECLCKVKMFKGDEVSRLRNSYHRLGLLLDSDGLGSRPPIGWPSEIHRQAQEFLQECHRLGLE